MSDKKPTFYLSVDVETDGMCPGVNSMLSLGAVMLNEAGDEIGQFSENLIPLAWPAHPDHETMKWWESHQEAYAKATENPEQASLVMHNFREWVESFEGRVIFIGYPVTFDFTFVWWYLWSFTGGAPFTHGGMDLKSVASVLLDTPYYDSRKANWPQNWFPEENEHSHIAVEDAREQAYSWVKMSEEIAKRHEERR